MAGREKGSWVRKGWLGRERAAGQEGQLGGKRAAGQGKGGWAGKGQLGTYGTGCVSEWDWLFE